MPYNLSRATVTPPNTVLPQALCTSFVETNVYPILSNIYNSGEYQCSLVQDGVNPPRSLRTWVLAQLLTTAQFLSLWSFWQSVQNNGNQPFYYYSPLDVPPGQQQGSNWDATGTNVNGRAIVFFRGNWTQQTPVGGVGIPGGQSGRQIIPNLTLIEVA